MGILLRRFISWIFGSTLTTVIATALVMLGIQWGTHEYQSYIESKRNAERIEAVIQRCNDREETINKITNEAQEAMNEEDSFDFINQSDR